MQRTIQTELVINETPERVFQAWTDPVEFTQWWGSQETYHMVRGEMDLQRGGKWTAHGLMHPENKPFTISGSILSVDPPFNLAFTWIESWDPHTITMVELIFMKDLNGTLIRCRHVGDPTAEAAENHRQAWQSMFSWLKTHIEPTPVAMTDEPDLDAIMASFSQQVQ